MTVFSKFAPAHDPPPDGDEYSSLRTASFHEFSLPQNRHASRYFFEHQLDLSCFPGSSSACNHKYPSSGSGSLAVYGRRSYTSGFGVVPASPDAMAFLGNHRSHSRFSASPDYNDPDTADLLELRVENEKLKREIRDLRDHLQATSCALFSSLSIIHTLLTESSETHTRTLYATSAIR